MTYEGLIYLPPKKAGNLQPVNYSGPLFAPHVHSLLAANAGRCLAGQTLLLQIVSPPVAIEFRKAQPTTNPDLHLRPVAL